MSSIYFVATAGLLSLVGGVILVNVASTPRAAQIGAIAAGCGVSILVVVAIRQMLV